MLELHWGEPAPDKTTAQKTQVRRRENWTEAGGEEGEREREREGGCVLPALLCRVPCRVRLDGVRILGCLCGRVRECVRSLFTYVYGYHCAPVSMWVTGAVRCFARGPTDYLPFSCNSSPSSLEVSRKEDDVDEDEEDKKEQVEGRREGENSVGRHTPFFLIRPHSPSPRESLAFFFLSISRFFLDLVFSSLLPWCDFESVRYENREIGLEMHVSSRFLIAEQLFDVKKRYECFSSFVLAR